MLFEVWVPEKTVKLLVAGEERAMERVDDGIACNEYLPRCHIFAQ